MNKKGFTLIELLAVIVILAIIALIATPIVLNIINDAKEESGLRSAEFYLKSLELSIAQAVLDGQNIEDGTYNIMPNGNLCLENYQENNKQVVCNDSGDGNPNNNELIVEVKGKVPASGTIAIQNGQVGDISLTLDNKIIEKNSKEELVYQIEKTLNNICEYKSGPKGERSSKYECKVDPNKKPYTFYILSYLDKDGKIITDKTNAVSVNLIMDSNIRIGGEAVKESTPSENQKGLVSWINSTDGNLAPYDGENCYNEEGCVTNDKGPITAMNYLQASTKDWTNVNELKINKFESCYQEDCYNSSMSQPYNMYSRMPYYSELWDYLRPENIWLIDYLDGTNDETFGINGRTTSVSGVDGYWTLTSNFDYPYGAWYVSTGAYVTNNSVADYTGVRPVINLKF